MRPWYTEYHWYAEDRSAYGTCGSLSYAKRVVEVAAKVADGDPEGDAETLVSARQIATRVRERAEEIAPSIGTDLSLRNFCVAASLGLRHALKKAGVLARLAAGHFEHIGHCWVEVPLSTGNAILDVTATQCGDRWPAVVVVPPGSEIGKSYWTIVGGERAAENITPPALALLRAAPRGWWADPERSPVPRGAVQVAEGDGEGDR